MLVEGAIHDDVNENLAAAHFRPIRMRLSRCSTGRCEFSACISTISKKRQEMWTDGLKKGNQEISYLRTLFGLAELNRKPAISALGHATRGLRVSSYNVFSLWAWLLRLRPRTWTALPARRLVRKSRCLHRLPLLPAKGCYRGKLHFRTVQFSGIRHPRERIKIEAVSNDVTQALKKPEPELMFPVLLK
jgi:hypothetical protein